MERAAQVQAVVPGIRQHMSQDSMIRFHCWLEFVSC